MTSPGWIVLLASMALAGSAAAAPSCPDQLATLDRWLATAKTDAANGAVMSDGVDRLVAIPLKKGAAPKQSAMTLVIDKDGLRDGNKPARPIGDAKAIIDANPNIAWARGNANAISRGILVAGASDAPAASVRAAVVAAAASGEQVWLVFRPGDAKVKAPAESPLTKELAPLGSADVSKLVEIITRELGACDGLMGMMRKLSGQTEATRLTTMIDATGPAVKKCQCKPSADRVASILWTLAFQNLGTLVAVPAKDVGALPWGGAKATWADAAPAVVKALGR
jgi:hypothetical protein